jgi:hypothetical protein
MKINHKITIDLLEFVKSGQFDFIKLGQTKEWILQNFPDPDGFDDSAAVYAHPIWRYGNIEFHFSQNELTSIYSDYIDELSGGSSLELKKWIFSVPQNLTLPYVMEQLNQQRIDFKTVHKTYGDLTFVSVSMLKSKVTLGFSPAEKDDETLQGFLERNRQEDANLFKLQSISLTSS